MASISSMYASGSSGFRSFRARPFVASGIFFSSLLLALFTVRSSSCGVFPLQLARHLSASHPRGIGRGPRTTIYCAFIVFGAESSIKDKDQEYYLSYCLSADPAIHYTLKTGGEIPLAPPDSSASPR